MTIQMGAKRTLKPPISDAIHASLSLPRLFPIGPHDQAKSGRRLCRAQKPNCQVSKRFVAQGLPLLVLPTKSNLWHIQTLVLRQTSMAENVRQRSPTSPCPFASRAGAPTARKAGWGAHPMSTCACLMIPSTPMAHPNSRQTTNPHLLESFGTRRCQCAHPPQTECVDRRPQSSLAGMLPLRGRLTALRGTRPKPQKRAPRTRPPAKSRVLSKSIASSAWRRQVTA